MQRRAVDALTTVPGVEAAALADEVPLGDNTNDSVIFSDGTTDLRPSKAAATPVQYSVSPGYFRAAGTALLSGRTFTWHDDQSAPRVAVVNREFARPMFGSVTKAMGGYFKLKDGARVQIVGIAEDGRYASLTEDQLPAMFLSILQSPSSRTYLVVHCSSGSQPGAAIRNKLRELNARLPVYIETRYRALDPVLFGPRMATISLGVLGVMGAVLSMTGIFGMTAYSVSRRLGELGIRLTLGAQRREILETALGRAFKLLAFGSVAGTAAGHSGEPGLGRYCLPSNASGSIGIGRRCRGHGAAGTICHVDSGETSAISESFDAAEGRVNLVFGIE